ncbi:hypothetical protein EYF80_026136 [Liparis tanakae]|uniref:Uncharacterized protein n=1 Tax=Liparis tanakae TaxID=230148 RepID=A0A4Z2HDJ3_9TELE|nr:hypothetical protein EYF80_026136 [Liparis tanakae]
MALQLGSYYTPSRCRHEDLGGGHVGVGRQSLGPRPKNRFLLLLLPTTCLQLLAGRQLPRHMGPSNASIHPVFVCMLCVLVEVVVEGGGGGGQPVPSKNRRAGGHAECFDVTHPDRLLTIGPTERSRP